MAIDVEQKAETEPARAGGRGPSARFWYGLAGATMVAMFFGLAMAPNGYSITYKPPFASASPGELFLWIAATLLLTPGMFLLGFAMNSRLRVFIERVLAAARALSTREQIAAILALFVVYAAAARLGRSLVLSDLPITDDEYAVKFGGAVLASGSISIPVPDFYAAVPNLFFVVVDGRYTSMDWPGVQVAWAVALLTRLDDMLWALVAAMPLVALTFAVWRRLGLEWALAALLLFLVSPMAALLSLTSHAHLLSRAFLSVAVACLAVALEGGSRRWWVAIGFLFGASFCCRPIETSMFAVPLAVYVLAGVLRGDPQFRAAFVAASAGALPPLAGFLLFNLALSGTPLPGRRLPGRFVGTPFPAASPLERFGTNTSFNALMLSIWFAGPLGAVLALLGVGRDRLAVLLTWSLVCLLALGLFHDNTGIHAVGPIHYSECVVPLVVLACYGARRLHDWSLGHGQAALPLVAALVPAIAVSSVVFACFGATGLRNQAIVQEYVYGVIERAVPADERVVVLAPHFGRVWNRVPQLNAVGSWVFVWRRPHPDYSDRILILEDKAEALPAVRAAFADRAFYRLRSHRRPPYIEVFRDDDLDGKP